MKNCHIFTLGASLIVNASKDSNISENIKNILKNWLNRVPGSDEDLKTKSEFVSMKSQIMDELLNILSKDPIKNSAELNAYINFIEEYPEYKANKIILYPTATGLGFVVKEILIEYIRNSLNINDVEVIQVNNFGKGPEYFDAAILELIDKLSNRIPKLKSDYLIFLNLTGGFKPEISITLIAGALFDINQAYYIYERFNKIVSLPILPLKIDNNILDIINNTFKGRQLIPVPEISQEDFDELWSRGLIVHQERTNTIKLRAWVRKIINIL
ncbi:MAG: putative CRISPR-associated protein [Candidatus Helarchaeota archaeon]